jgi:hypothetical protein
MAGLRWASAGLTGPERRGLVGYGSGLRARPKPKGGVFFFQKLFSMQKYFQKSLENKLMARKILKKFQ